LASPHYAQKRSSTIVGNTFTGDVVSSNETTREITITYTDKDTNKTETFVGVLKPGYQVRLRDGTQRDLQMSDIKPGVRVRVLYKEKSDNVAGQKVKFSEIISLTFLGRDDYTSLREALDVPLSLPVTLAPSKTLPAANPLKLYVAIQEPSLKQRVIKWAGQWNKEQAAKYGSVEIVSDLDQSDVAAVFFWGEEDSPILLPMLALYGGDLHQLFLATVHLVTKDSDGVKVLWQSRTFESPKKIEGTQGLIERELEKRLKARGKQ
ncbi:MAG TPA: hypothetical protein VGK82_15465, partial [Pyrinomonadaceae bacterium]